MTVYLEGIDISHHQATVPDLTGVDFVVCRATYGVTPDRLYPQHAAAVRAAGKILGAYHFARPYSVGEPAAEQAAAFLAAAPDADFWVVDREPDGDNGTITAHSTRALIAAIRATGRRVGLYASESMFRDFGQDFAWVANWSREPAIGWDLWQYQGSPLDRDRFRGTRGALLALGAPLEEWVTAQAQGLRDQVSDRDLLIDSLKTELGDAHAELEVVREDRDRWVDRHAELAVEIADIAAGLRTVRAFEERHP